MRQTVVVHIYQFVRMSHIEPSRFIRDDFETIQKEITLVKQYGFPLSLIHISEPTRPY